MIGDLISVLAVGLDDDLHDELVREEGFDVERVERLDEDPPRLADVDAVVLSLAGPRPLETLGTLRAAAPEAGLVVITDGSNAANGAIALHAGAQDHLVRGAIPPGLLPRAVRYALGIRRLRRDLATQDETTGLPNLRGFAPIAEHHLRMADRARSPVVFLFVRIEGLADAMRSGGPPEADAIVREAAAVLLEAVRDSDVPARIAADTFCVLLTGSATGSETLVLSRLVEAIAVHDARSDQPRSLSLSLGSALYDPERPSTLQQILETADRRLTEQRNPNRSERA